MNFEYNSKPEQYKKKPLTKAQGRLVNINDFDNNQKRFYILPRYFPKPTEKEKLAQWKVSMEVAASTYISQDLSVSTLLKDSRELLSLNYTPDCILQNDTRKKVTDLKSIPSGTFLYVKRDVEPQFKSKKLRLRLFRNINPNTRDDGILYHTKKGGIDQLLKDSQKLFRLQPDEIPQKLCLSSGKELCDLNSLSDDMITDVIVCLENEDFYQPPNDDSISKQSEVKLENPLIEQSDDIHNYIIGMSNISVEKAKIYAKCAAFQMLTEKERRVHPEAKKIRQMMKGTHQQGFNQQMVSQMIVPPISNKFITNALVRKSIEILDDNELGVVRYVISGARGSGKSTFLYIFANTLVRKLRMCDEEFNYLMFPINFEKYSMFKDDPLQIYNLFIETGFESANYTQFEFIRYSAILKQYLLQLPIQMNTKKPPINFKEFEGFSNEVVKCFQNGGKDIAKVLQKFPMLLAKALNLQSAILIIDHFDEFECDFCLEFAKSFSKSSFIISSKDDKKFYSVFQKSNAEILYTDKELLKPRDERILSVPEFKLRLTANDCFGSPGYLVSFTEICDLIESYQHHLQTDQSSREKFHNIRAKAELSRKFYIRQKLYNLCVALFTAHSEIIKSITLNKLGDISDSNFSFQLTGKVDRAMLNKADSESDEEDEDSYHQFNASNGSPSSLHSPNNNSRNSSPGNFSNNNISSRNNSPSNNNFNGSRNISPSNFDPNKRGSRNTSPSNFDPNRRGSRNNSPTNQDFTNKKDNLRSNSPSNFNNSRDRFRNDFDSSDDYNDYNKEYEYGDDDYHNYRGSGRNYHQSSQMIVVDKSNSKNRGISKKSRMNSSSTNQKNQRPSNLRSSLDNQQGLRTNLNTNVSFAPNLKQGQQRLDGSSINSRTGNNYTSQRQASSHKDPIQRRKSDFDSSSDD